MYEVQRYISIHAPAGGATSCWEWHRGIKSISIHAPAGGATSFRESLKQGWLFQFTPLREGRRALALWGAKTCKREFQFTPLREGRQLHRAFFQRQVVISIHAPAGGATRVKLGDTKAVSVISIHAPAGGATPRGAATRCCITNFNSRPCGRGDGFTSSASAVDILFQFTPLREGRRAAAVELAKLDNISIHAPAGGATCNRERCAIIISDFNSRPCGRGDECDCTHANRSCKFQFTPLREGRLFQSAHRAQVVDFNSRPCGRGDQNL